MSKLSTLAKLLREDKHELLVALFNNTVHAGITNFLSDELFLKLAYRIRFGEKLNLKNPVTFNQKLQWLKLYDRQDRYIELVDKVLVKDYVAKTIGAQYIIPTLGVWDTVEEIDFDNLPNQFVLKCNHDSGSIVICKDKADFDINVARKKLSKALESDMYYVGREWPYKGVKRRILAEAYLEVSGEDVIKDYKFMAFNGSVKCSFVVSERFSKDGIKVTFFDNDWNVMPFERHYPISKKEIKKPINYNEMVTLAEQLSKDIPFARIDFYEVDGKTYFGEITLFPGSGWEEFSPSEWDEKLGSWIKLPERGIAK